MGMPRKQSLKALLPSLIVVSLLVAGCAGIESYEPRDSREEGPEQGLISGSDGEFVIYRKADEPETDSEAGKESEETTDNGK